MSEARTCRCGDQAAGAGERLREIAVELGYAGGKSIFDDYVREVRPRFRVGGLPAARQRSRPPRPRRRPYGLHRPLATSVPAGISPRSRRFAPQKPAAELHRRGTPFDRHKEVTLGQP